MAKRVVQDIIIGRGARPVGGASSGKKVVNTKNLPPKDLLNNISRQNRNKSSRILFFFGGAILISIIVGIIYALSPSVVIEVTSRTSVLPVLLSAEASKTVQKDSADMSYSTVRINETISREIEVISTKEVDRRATGNIVVFNTVTSEPTRLVARTRFETPEGVTFRSQDPFVVPGYSSVDGKKIPGTIEITVHADEPGDKYNIGFSDFTIPGLSGTPLFDGFFARSKTEIGGGFSGKVQVVDDEAVEAMRKSLTAELTDSIKKKLQADVPAEKIAFDDGLIFTVKENLDDRVVAGSEDTAMLSITVTATAILLDRVDVSDYVVASSGVLDLVNAYVDNIDSLTTLFANASNESINESVLESESVLSLNISGNAIIKWEISEELVREALSGTTKDVNIFESLFSEQFPQIGQARVSSIRPFWLRKFPDDPMRIMVVEKDET